MMVLGIDAHKRSHTAVAVDELGRQHGHTTVPATTAGNLELVRWSRQFGEHRFAVEDCRHLSRRLERDLLAAGEQIVRVNPRLMGKLRASAREKGKSDPIDAMSVARAAQREEGLPLATLDGKARDVKLLVDHREDLVCERTRFQNRLRWHLHELDPGLEIAPGALDRFKVLDAAEAHIAQVDGTVARIARSLLDKVRALTVEVNALEREIASIIQHLAPSLLELVGCGPLTAAKLLGEVASVGRFSSKAQFARFNGTAPIPVWSGNKERFRLNRGGNRQVNAALHRIAITQLRIGPGRDYVARKQAAGHTRAEAIRTLRRQLSDEVFRRLRADAGLTKAAADTCVRAAA